MDGVPSYLTKITYRLIRVNAFEEITYLLQNYVSATDRHFLMFVEYNVYKNTQVLCTRLSDCHCRRVFLYALVD